jgi:hypothetical protein
LDNSKDIAVAILGAVVALAGLLLVFVGFVYTRGESMASKRGDKFKNIARAGIVPFGISLACAWTCVTFLQARGSVDLTLSVFLFRLDLIVSGLYAVIVLFVYL